MEAGGESSGTRRTDLRADYAGIVAEWERLSVEEPWHVDPRRYGIDSLHETIRAVLDVATWSGADTSAHERLVRTATKHGEQRRSQGTGDDALLREYHALRAAIWRFMERSSVPASEALAVIVRIDIAISVATTAALRGYHRSELPPSKGWEAEIVRQVQAASRHLANLLGDGGQA